MYRQSFAILVLLSQLKWTRINDFVVAFIRKHQSIGEIVQFPGSIWKLSPSCWPVLQGLYPKSQELLLHRMVCLHGDGLIQDQSSNDQLHLWYRIRGLCQGCCQDLWRLVRIMTPISSVWQELFSGSNYGQIGSCGTPPSITQYSVDRWLNVSKQCNVLSVFSRYCGGTLNCQPGVTSKSVIISWVWWSFELWKVL